MYTLKTDPSQEIFRAYDVRGLVDKNLFEEDYYSIGVVYGLKALQKKYTRVIVARDVRPSSKRFVEALTAGLNRVGLAVVDLGEVPTPVLNYATKCLSSAGLMVTGSHNPKPYNGLKMILDGEVLTSEEIQDLRNQLLSDPVLPTVASKPENTHFDIMPRYLDEMSRRLPAKKKLKVVVDAGNGVGGVVASQLYEKLGMDVELMYCEPDGEFPNHHPNPGDPKNLEDLIAKVKTTKADVGLAFDGDGDRLGVITASGRIVWPDQLLLWMTHYLVSQGLNPTVVFDVKCEQYVVDYIAKWSGTPILWKTGHSLIRQKIKGACAHIGGEMSGHLFLPYFWYDFDDAFAASAVLLKVLSESIEPLDNQLNFIPHRYSSAEMIVDVPEKDKFEIVESFKNALSFDNALINEIDGVRVCTADAWFLLRASNTTSALTIRISAENKAIYDEVQHEIQKTLSAVYPGVKL